MRIKVGRPSFLTLRKEGGPRFALAFASRRPKGKINEANYIINQTDYLRVTGGGLLKKVLYWGRGGIIYGIRSLPMTNSCPLDGVSAFLVVSFLVTSPLPLEVVEVNDSEEKNRLKTRSIIGMTGLILC